MVVNMPYVILSETTVNLNDLLNILLGLAGMIALLLLGLFLYNLSALVKKIKSMLDELNLPISQTVNQLPEVVKKTDKSLADINSITETTAGKLPLILDDLTGVSKALGTTVETVANTTTNIVDGVDGAVLGVKRGVSNIASNINMNGLISMVGKITGLLAFIRKLNKKRRR